MAQDIISLAKALGAKNITNSAFANSSQGRQFLQARERRGNSEKILNAATTPIGAISGGIGLYLQRKRENKALGELNRQLERDAVVNNERRSSLINSLPEDQRMVAGALEDKDLMNLVLKNFTPAEEKDKLSLQNQRLQNQKLQRDLSSQGIDSLDKENKLLRNQKLRQDISGTSPKKNKPIPASALKIQNDLLEGVGLASGINKDLDSLVTQLDENTLELGPVSNLLSQARNASGFSSPESINFSSFKSTLEKLRNDSLRLNKGVQTEGDAQRIWNELIANINDEGVVKQRLGEIKELNKRAVDLRKFQVDQIRSNFGADAMDFGEIENVESALNRNKGELQASNGVKFTIKR